MHWLVVLAIILVLFGAGKLPRVMGDFAKGIKAFKSGMKEQDEEEAAAAAAPPQVPPPAGTAASTASPAPANATVRVMAPTTFSSVLPAPVTVELASFSAELATLTCMEFACVTNRTVAPVICTQLALVSSSRPAANKTTDMS